VKMIDMTGLRFGRYTVIERAETMTGAVHWVCLCDCGTEKVVRGTHLRSGKIVSCGCYSRDMNITHAHCGTPEYRAYFNMLKRCFYENDKRYDDYGGRGIKVHGPWLNSFENFLEDMGVRPSKKHSLDRIDVNGNYTPDNCRWATKEVQSRNTRTRKDSKTGAKGVVKNNRGKYVAQIYHLRKTIRIGTYNTLEEAKRERQKAELALWGESI
jgi:hypothetical protein